MANEAVELLIFCLLVSGVNKFINDCFDSDMILRRYYLRLVYYWIKWRKNKTKRQFLKPLGLCIYCMNFWITLILFMLFYGINLNVLLCFGGTHLFLKIFERG